MLIVAFHNVDKNLVHRIMITYRFYLLSNTADGGDIKFAPFSPLTEVIHVSYFILFWESDRILIVDFSHFAAGAKYTFVYQL